MHSDAGIGGAGAARDEAHAGLARQLAVGLGPVTRAAFLAADDRRDGAAYSCEASTLDLNFNEHAFAIVRIDHVVFDTGGS